MMLLQILLPSSALDWLVRLNIQYPMMFRITNTNPETQRVTHCGVLEFLAEEGRCYLPSWMMRQLLLAEGDVAQIQYASLPLATYAKFKPQSPDFLNISNPRAVLEVELRKFACLSKNDLIAVRYNDQVLEFLVQEVKPGNAVTIIECDMNVEFDAPEGYVEPTVQRPSEPAFSKPPAPAQTVVVPDKRFAAFTGSGQRLDGKT
uniref:Ubiquitin fusion degradaton protein n=1 Tax=Plectus sambesii TaxID=2011161 RepID=A0A914UYR1_9BILA